MIFFIKFITFYFGIPMPDIGTLYANYHRVCGSSCFTSEQYLYKMQLFMIRLYKNYPKHGISINYKGRL